MDHGQDGHATRLEARRETEDQTFFAILKMAETLVRRMSLVPRLHPAGASMMQA